MTTRSGIKLPRGPTCLDCLAWSEDCEIAVACEDSLEILFPKLNIDIPLPSPDSSEAENWQTVRVLVNVFTPLELPLLPPSPFSIFSIGEEQSPSTIAAVAWSPCGLGQYKKCAVAVLTTNLVLSIWAHDGSPTLSSLWKRVLIVNNALQAPPRPGSTPKDAQRTRFRARSFCWAPSLEQYSQSAGFDGFQAQTRDPFFIAVSNDAHEIVICEIRSPFLDPLKPQSDWSARAVLRFDLPTTPPPNDGMIFGPITFATHLAWSPWTKDHQSGRSEYRSCLSFVSNSIGYLKELVLNNESFPPKLYTVANSLPLGSHYSGPMRWAHHPNKSNALVLGSANEQAQITEVSLFVPDTGVHISPPSQSQSVFSWTKISGLAFGMSTNELALYTVAESMKREANPLSFSLPVESSGFLESLEWAFATQEVNQDFADTEKNFTFGSVFKFWGLCSNSNNDHLLQCASVHPKDVIYHSTTSERDCVIFIKAVDKSSPAPIIKTSSAEATCFSIARYIGYQSSNDVCSSDKLESFRNWLNCTSTPLKNWAEILQLKPTVATPEDAVSLLWNMFQPSSIAISRIYSSLLLAQDKSDSNALNEPPSGLISQFAFFCTIQKMPQHIWKSSKLTDLILWQFSQAQELLCQVWPAYFKKAMGKSRPPSFASDETLGERCELCGSKIFLEDTGWGQCLEGHQYERCGLTLLAIQSPGTSKYCGLCGKRYLSKAYLASLNPAVGGNTSAASISRVDGPETREAHETNERATSDESRRPEFVEILHAGCGTCLLCGGKFKIA